MKWNDQVDMKLPTLTLLKSSLALSSKLRGRLIFSPMLDISLNAFTRDRSLLLICKTNISHSQGNCAVIIYSFT